MKSSKTPTMLFITLLVTLIFNPSLFAFGQDQGQPPSTAAIASPDEAALAAIARQLYAAQEKNDLAGVLQLFSKRSPEYTNWETEMRQTFAQTPRAELKELKINRIKMEGESAFVRLNVKLDRFDTAGKPDASSIHQRRRTLYFVKEDGQWKIWRNARSLVELSNRLAEASDKEARAALMADHQDLLLINLSWECNHLCIEAYQRGEYSTALRYGIGAYEVAEKLGSKVDMARSLNNIGEMHLYQSNFRQALDYYGRTLELSKELEGRDGKIGLIHSFNNIGEVHRRQGNYQPALNYFRQCLLLCEEIKFNRMKSTCSANIGAVYLGQGKFDAAQTIFEQTLALGRNAKDVETLGNSLLSLAEICSAREDHLKAMEYLREALPAYEKYGNKAGKALTLAALARTHHVLGDDQSAVDFAAQSAAIARELGQLDAFWQARLALGQAQRALSHPQEARRAFEEAISAIEEMRSQVAGNERDTQRFLSHKLSPYREMVDLLVGQNDAAGALGYAERGKARALLDVLRNGRANITKAMTPAELKQERELNDALTALNKQLYVEQQSPTSSQARIFDLKTRLREAQINQEAFLTQLYNAHPALGARRGQTTAFKLEMAQSLLRDEKTALAEYVVTNEKTYLFVLTGKASPELKTYTIAIPQKRLGELTTGFHQALAERNLLFGETAAKLYRILLKPAEAQLRGKSHLVIVPDGVLWELPFEALQSKTGGAIRQRFVIEDYAVSRAPSLTVLAEMTKLRNERPRSAPATLLAFGNPSLDGEPDAVARFRGGETKLEPLPHAENEVREIARLFGANRSRLYTGAAAREDRFKAEAGSFRILHIATHGLLNDANPLYSQIVLSQTGNPPDEDGLLEAWEIMNLELKSDLVVLSACETARGGVTPGEGVIGLSWALFVAGSPAAVVSQWKVDSGSTTELMKEFHRQLLIAAPNKAGALRAAALKLMRGNYRHPFYWAGFVLVGDAF